MIRYKNEAAVWQNGAPVKAPEGTDKEAARRGTIAYQIMDAHRDDTADGLFHIHFDALVSHDITYVGIIQTARASGLREFPVPYAMTNCHNSLCAVGGTINEDDHVFGLSAAKKYGGIYVPANQSVIHSYAREELAACGSMILGSDSHTRYGALGTMGVGEGGPELVKQLLKNTWDINPPEVVLCYLTGSPRKGIGPHDVALSLVKETFGGGLVKNKVLEFAGPGLASLPYDFRSGIDVRTTETTCLSSIWATDEEIEKYYAIHKRPECYRKLEPAEGAYYDAVITIELDKVESMIALPFHPSNAYTIHEFLDNAEEILAGVEAEAAVKFPAAHLDLRSKVRGKGVLADQGVIAGCSGGIFDNIVEAADILKGQSTGSGYFSLSVYPTSVPTNLALARAGKLESLLEAGALIKPSFCGPCFGAGDVPANNGLSLRHTTRNFPNREGSKPGEGQISGVALMDARSIAATAANGGYITAATDIDYDTEHVEYTFDNTSYKNRCYYGFGKADTGADLILGPNITDWPKIYPLADNMLLELDAVIRDPVTTTDELIPSGETSSYRSNPLRLAEFALSRRVPEYVPRSKAVKADEEARRNGESPAKIAKALEILIDAGAADGAADELMKNTKFGSCVFSMKPGDGSAREQAASCQKVLGGAANICYEYATKRYRSNCINWGLVPFTLAKDTEFPYEEGDMVFVPGIRGLIESGCEDIPAKVICAGADGPAVKDITLHVAGLTDDEKDILLKGYLMNYYAAQSAER
ncbi:MAG: hydratase [Mogibacterium sp.]|nr:hydratase [Mogibacterium sp.]